MEDKAVTAIIDKVNTVSEKTLDQATKKAAKKFLADSLAVGFSGYHEPVAAQLRQTTKQWGTSKQACLIGTQERQPSTSAAFCNAFQIHCQEFDCLHEAATVHAMAVLVGSLVAVADREKLTIEDALKAIVVGVDVAAGLGLAAKKGLTFFRPATAGAMGTAAAFGTFVKLDEVKLKNFMGLVYSQLAGTMQAHIEGSVALPLQIGAAARSVITALDLSREGIGGPHNVMTGPYGYFNLFEQDANCESFVTELKTKSRVLELSHKPFPTGRAAHAILDGIRSIMRENHLVVDDIKEIKAAVPPLIKRLVDRPIKNDMSASYARLCIYYLSALMMRDLRIDRNSFSPANLKDNSLQIISRKLVLIDNDLKDPNALSPQHIILQTFNGQTFELDIHATLGHPDNPLTYDDQIEKITNCLQTDTHDESKTYISKATDLLDMKEDKLLEEVVATL